MEDAIALYTRYGFRRCPPYYEALESFRDISVFMELALLGQDAALHEARSLSNR
jgi:hypothetical protein